MILNRGETIINLYLHRRISKNTRKKLHENGFMNLGDILDYIEGDINRLSTIRNLDNNSLKEIKEVLQNKEKHYSNRVNDNPDVTYKSKNEGRIHDAKEPIGEETSIDELYEMGQISIRSLHGLNNAKLLCVKDIISYIKGDKNRILNIRNLGRKSLLEISKVLDSLESADSSKPENDIIDEDISNESRDGINVVYNNRINLLEYRDICGYLLLLFPNGENLIDELVFKNYNLLTLHPSLGKEGNIKLRSFYSSFLDAVLRRSYFISFSPKIKEKLENIFVCLELTKEQFSLQDELFLANESQKERMQIMYQSLCSKLSVRAKKMQEKHFPTYFDTIQYLDKDLKEYGDLCPGQNMAKTLSQLYYFIQLFKYNLNQILKTNPEQVKRGNISLYFDFLEQDEQDFVFNYLSLNKSYPLFYLLYYYIKKSTDRDWKIFSLYNGLVDGKSYTLEEIASIHNLSRERVRQLLVDKPEISNQYLRENKDWNNYSGLLNLPYITELSPKFRMIQEDECLPYDFSVFARMLPSVANFAVFQVLGKYVAINNNLLATWDFKKQLKALETIFENKYSRDASFNIKDFVGVCPEETGEDAWRLIHYIVSIAYGYSVGEDGGFTIEQNLIDISQEIYDILFKKGEPMHIEDLFKAFKELYPEHKYEDSKYLRPYLHKHPHIMPIGNTSTYALDSWDIYFGGVRDRIREILGKSRTPMEAEDIVMKVLEVIPYTNRASILSTIASKDFVSFNQGLWGLANKKYDSKYLRSQVGPSRKPFPARFNEFKKFVDTYHRFPFSNGGEHEQMLFRWLHNVRNDIISVTTTQKTKFELTIQEYRKNHYPENPKEYNCLNKCNDYREYIEANYELPTRKDNIDLYNWIHFTKREYNSFTGNMLFYVTELFDYIRSYGFVI